MSNSIAPGSSADVNVKVTALTTNTNVPAQYKTIILKKNLVNGVNTLTQEMMSAKDTKYMIKYDYVLGDDITIPANCVLEFDGGSLSNGTIIGNNTKIKASCSKIFNNVICTGSYKNAVTYFSWFSHSNANNTEELKSLFVLSEGSIFTDVYIEEGLFYVDGYDEQNESPAVCHIPDNSYIHNLATFKILGTSHDTSRPFYIAGRKNITLEGGRIIGCIDDYEVHPNYQGHYGLRICGAENITVKNIIFDKCVSDGIEMQYNVSLSMHNKHIRIDSVICDHSGRQGLSIEDGDDIIVTNSIFKNTGNPIGTNPKCGIDVEPYYSDAIIYNCLIENCIFENNTNGDVQLHLGYELYNNIVLNNLICDGRIIVSSLGANEEVRIKNSKFTQFSLGANNGSVYIDNCNFTNIYSSKVSKLFISNCRIIYLDNSVHQAVLYFDVTYNENQLVQIVNSYIETNVGAYINSKTKVNFIDCYIKVIGSVSGSSSIQGDIIGCTLDITEKAIDLKAISNSDLTIKNSSIFLHNTGASYSEQWAPIRFMSNGNYRIIGSRIIVDEDSSQVEPVHVFPDKDFFIPNILLAF